MLCEIAPDNFLISWAILTILGFTIVMSSSAVVFYHFYWPSKITYEKWRFKTNPKYPSPSKVRDEIVQTAKSVAASTLSPTITMLLANKGYSKGYCGSLTDDPFGKYYPILTFIVVVLLSDFFEFAYHRVGHTFKFGWTNHKHHHNFFNPSPFAVIADEYIDQIVRSSPLLIFPLVAPINMDVMFLTYSTFFYAYGLYLHWGYETVYLTAHNPIFNTSYHHYCHHAKAILNKPYHCGFFFKIWDDVSGGVYPVEKCFCVGCEQKKGLRSEEHFKKVVIPDYGVLLKSDFWLQKGVLGGVSAKDENEGLKAEGEGKDKAY